MYSKDHFLGAISHEVNVIKHLASKIPDGVDGYKPTDKQRSLLELLQYLSIMTPSMLKMISLVDYSVFGAYTAKSESTTRANFDERMNESLAETTELLNRFTDEDLDQEVEMFGTKQTKRLFLLNVLTMLAGYKMQLFLYVKSAGNQDIGTSNVWRGMDQIKI
ncbi:MAG: hypothetical protein K8Q91_00325 [Candidatus Vogelbacteria bacterium]|nr:hypothetical protein [Candidatus Vogelbacteria bacterium]